MGSLDGGLGEKDAVVGDDADLVAVDAGEARHERGAVVALELGEFAPVDESGDDFVRGDLAPEVGADDAVQFGGVVEWLFDGFCGGGGRGKAGFRVVEVGDGAAGEN